MKQVLLIVGATVCALMLLPTQAGAQKCPECEEYSLDIPDPRGKGGSGSGTGSQDTGAVAPAPVAPAPSAAPVPAEPEPAPEPVAVEGGDEPEKDKNDRKRRKRDRPEQDDETVTVTSNPLTYGQRGPTEVLAGQFGGGAGLLVALGGIALAGFWTRPRSGKT